MNRPLVIRDIHNISLTGSNVKSNVFPQLVAQFPCQYRPRSKSCIHIRKSAYPFIISNSIEVCCSIIHLINVTNSTFRDITIAVRSQNVSGVILQQCSEILIQLFKVEGHSGSQRNVTCEVGILTYESTSIVLNTLQVSNISYGVILFNTSNSYITDTATMNCHESGIELIVTNNSNIVNTISSNNDVNGVVLQSTNNVNLTNITAVYNNNEGKFSSVEYENTIMINISAAYNVQYGIELQQCNNTIMSNISAAYNQQFGIGLHQCNDTIMINVSAVYNQQFGIVLYQCNDTSMVNISATHNQEIGIGLWQCNATSMINVSATYNQEIGIALQQSNDTSMINISAAYNQYNGIQFYQCNDTSMINISAAYNQLYGIVPISCSNANMINIYAANNGQVGIQSVNCTNTSMISIIAVYNQVHGIGFKGPGCNNTSMINISAAHNRMHGIGLEKCTGTNMINISATYNQQNGVTVLHCHYISMINISAVQNRIYGIAIARCNATSLLNISSSHNQTYGMELMRSTHNNMTNIFAAHNQFGMMFGHCTNTSMINISTAYNQYLGISINYCTNTSMNAVSVAYTGIFLRQCTDTRMINISAVYVEERGISLMNCKESISLEDSVFLNVSSSSTPNHGSGTDPSTLAVIITLDNSFLTVKNCNFTRNSLSSVKVMNSTIRVLGKVIFSNNSALSGTAFIFERSSKLIISDDSYIIFRNNHASQYGGAILVHTEEMQGTSMSLHDVLVQNFESPIVILQTECFVHVEGSRLDAKLIFMNNTAGKGGDVLYGGLVALGYDEDWNCLLGFKNVSDMSQQSGLSLISSAPSRICLCNETGQPDCLTIADPTPYVIYPGQTITIPAVVVGQDFGTVTGSVFAHFLGAPYTSGSVDMKMEQKNKTVEQTQCSNLEYTIFSEDEESEAVLVLTTDNLKADIPQLMDIENNREIANTWTILNSELNYTKLASDYILDFIMTSSWVWQYTDDYYMSETAANRTIENFYKFTPGHFDHLTPDDIHNKFIFPNEIYNYPVGINISFRSCPPGFTLSRQVPFKCDCNRLLQQFPGVKCHIQHQTITRRSLVWVGMFGNDTVAVTEYCPLNYCNGKEMNVTLNNFDSQCNYNHLGTLCGGCQSGLSLALGSAQCLSCSNSYLSLLLAFIVAGFALVFFIKILDLTVSHGTMNGLIFYANIIKANEYIFYTQRYPSPLTLFISWLNLDIGVETCFFNGLTAYGKAWLQFVFPLYIWGIAVLIIILAKYNNRVTKIMGQNSVPVLATLFLLSYAKLFRTIITVLSYTMLHTTHGQKAVWSADGNLDYLGPKHAPLFAIAAATLLFLWLPYTLLLFLGQWLRRLNCRLIDTKMKPILDACYDPFNGKHHYWFGALLLVRAAVLLASALVPANSSRILVFSIAISAVLLPLWGQNVYRNSATRMFDMSYFVNLSLLAITKLFSNEADISVASYTLIGLAFVQFLGLIVYKIYLIIKRNEKVAACLHRREPHDDWEPYEQAALLRENEQGSEEARESDGSGSDVSLLTYGV